jgi:hypothetical protein
LEVEMSKAILGAHADPRTLELLDEVRALRQRVAALEAALEEAERAASARDDLPLIVAEEREDRALDAAGSPRL